MVICILLLFSFSFNKTYNQGVNVRNTYTIARHMVHSDLFLGYNFCLLCPNRSRFIGKVLMTIIHLASFFCNFQK